MTWRVCQEPRGDSTERWQLISGALVHVPENRHGRNRHTDDVLPDSDCRKPLAEYDVCRHLDGAHLNGLGNLLLLCRIGLARVPVAHHFDLLVAWPSGPRL